MTADQYKYLYHYSLFMHFLLCRFGFDWTFSMSHKHFPLLLEEGEPFIVLLLVELFGESVGYHFLFILFMGALLYFFLLIFRIGLRFCLLILALPRVRYGIILYLRQSLRFLPCCQGLTLFNPNQSRYRCIFLCCSIVILVNLYAFT